MALLLLFLLKHQTNNPAFDLAYLAVVLALLTTYTLWNSRYRRRWQQYRSRDWERIGGRFDEGEVITMRKGRSKTIAGYEVWLGYEYRAGGEQGGIYSLPFRTKDEAEAALRLLANKTIVVRVAPGKPKRSLVSDEDVSVLLPAGIVPRSS
jgi:hypothetical protein